MTTLVFRRHPKYQELVLRLQSDEELGVLDSGYLEDFYGVNGRVTLWHEATEQEFSLSMQAVPEDTPTVNHDVFRGRCSLDALLDGLYEVRFRCRDVAGNYTISNQVQAPLGGERQIQLRLDIVPAKGKRGKMR